CARVGCMPSKLLIAAAEASHAIDAAPGFGVHVDGAKRVDGREVMDRVRRERDRFVGFVVEGVGRIPADDRIEGRARFVDRRTLEVDGHTRVTARAIVIATGSRPAIPAMLAAAGDRLVVNDDVFSWETLPRSVAVFGPGVIGLELGQALSRLGVRVVVLGRGGRVGPLTDPVVRDAFLEAISDGLYVDPDAHVKRVARITEGVEVEYTRVDGTVRVESFDWLLAATGRRPNVDGLGLEALGLELDANGVPGFDPATLRVGDTNLFIAGDAANFIPLLHEAADEGRIAGDNAASLPETTPGHRRMPLAIVFTDPQVAIVGPGFDKLAPGTFEAGEVSFADQGRSRVMLRNRGHLRVYADRATGRFLGAEMAGPAAEHIGHLLAWAAANRMTVASMLEMPFYHPVVEEGLRTALRDLDAKLRSPQAIAA
ncbi:MAG TPA: dihydrolipoyl dehydrogenase, partial [Usitatibacteraceae bacterium]|nr:dihydrolipoyl dehydrogenase [Usitatibacteraceae bacterium]